MEGTLEDRPPEEQLTQWASVVALITCISIFGLALGLTYPLLAIMMVEAEATENAFELISEGAQAPTETPPRNINGTDCPTASPIPFSRPSNRESARLSQPSRAPCAVTAPFSSTSCPSK